MEKPQGPHLGAPRGLAHWRLRGRNHARTKKNIEIAHPQPRANRYSLKQASHGRCLHIGTIASAFARAHDAADRDRERRVEASGPPALRPQRFASSRNQELTALTRASSIQLAISARTSRTQRSALAGRGMRP